MWTTLQSIFRFVNITFVFVNGEENPALVFCPFHKLKNSQHSHTKSVRGRGCHYGLLAGQSLKQIMSEFGLIGLIELGVPV